MARANLNVQEGVSTAFKNAQEADSNVRSVVIKIIGEALVLDKSLDKSGSVEEDFNSLFATCLDKDTACFVLFCQTDACVSGKQWVFLCWIPDTSRVRDKMLYSSSVEDLKRSLGLGYFSRDYSCSMAGDLCWDVFQRATAEASSEEVLTSTERQIKEEALQSRNESNVSKSNAMGVMLFGFDQAALDTLERFRAGGCSWATFSVANETVGLCSVSSDPLATCAQGLGSDPRFCLYRHPNPVPEGEGTELSFFVFYCPDEAPVRSKMTMSSCKVNMAARLTEASVAVHASLEVRDRADLEEEILHRVREAQAGQTNGQGLTGAPDSVFNLTPATASSKPTRPGRGKAKISKFVSDLV